MAISNNSTGLRPGVCTSTTRPTAPYEGQTIYETDTDLTYVWGGSAWQQVSGGTAVGNSGLVYIAGASFSGITSGAPLDVNSVFGSTYTNYVLVLRVSQTVADGSFLLRMRTVSTLESGSVYNYGWLGTYVGAGPSYNYTGYATTNPFAPDSFLYTGISAGTGYSGQSRLDIMSPNVTRETRILGQSYTNYSGTYYNVAIHGTGEVATTTAYTGFRLYPSAGTLSGEYQLYGYRIA